MDDLAGRRKTLERERVRLEKLLDQHPQWRAMRAAGQRPERVDGAWRFPGLNRVQGSALRESLVFRAYQDVLARLEKIEGRSDGGLSGAAGNGVEVGRGETHGGKAHTATAEAHAAPGVSGPETNGEAGACEARDATPVAATDARPAAEAAEATRQASQGATFRTKVKIKPTGPNARTGRPVAVPPVVEPVAAPVAGLDQEAMPAGEASPSRVMEPTDGGVADDLTRIRSINRALAARLGAAGVTSFAQIASWNSVEVRRIGAQLDLDKRIWRENWIEQAAALVLKEKGAAAGDALQPRPLTPEVRQAAGEAAETTSDAVAAGKTAREVPVTLALPIARLAAGAEAPAVDDGACGDARDEAWDGAGADGIAGAGERDEAQAAGASAAGGQENAGAIAADAGHEADADDVLAAADGTAARTSPSEDDDDVVPAAEAGVAVVTPVADAPAMAQPAGRRGEDKARVKVGRRPQRLPAPAIRRLTYIRGLSDDMAERLRLSGVRSLSDIASWSAADVEWFQVILGDEARISADQWIEQAAVLAAGKWTSHALAVVRGVVPEVVLWPAPMVARRKVTAETSALVAAPPSAGAAPTVVTEAAPGSAVAAEPTELPDTDAPAGARADEGALESAIERAPDVGVGDGDDADARAAVSDELPGERPAARERPALRLIARGDEGGESPAALPTNEAVAAGDGQTPRPAEPPEPVVTALISGPEADAGAAVDDALRRGGDEPSGAGEPGDGGPARGDDVARGEDGALGDDAATRRDVDDVTSVEPERAAHDGAADVATAAAERPMASVVADDLVEKLTQQVDRRRPAVTSGPPESVAYDVGDALLAAMRAFDAAEQARADATVGLSPEVTVGEEAAEAPADDAATVADVEVEVAEAPGSAAVISGEVVLGPVMEADEASAFEARGLERHEDFADAEALVIRRGGGAGPAPGREAEERARGDADEGYDERQVAEFEAAVRGEVAAGDVGDDEVAEDAGGDGFAPLGDEAAVQIVSRRGTRRVSAGSGGDDGADVAAGGKPRQRLGFSPDFLARRMDRREEEAEEDYAGYRDEVEEASVTIIRAKGREEKASTIVPDTIANDQTANRPADGDAEGGDGADTADKASGKGGLGARFLKALTGD